MSNICQASLWKNRLSTCRPFFTFSDRFHFNKTCINRFSVSTGQNNHQNNFFERGTPLLVNFV